MFFFSQFIQKQKVVDLSVTVQTLTNSGIAVNLGIKIKSLQSSEADTAFRNLCEN